MTDKTPLPSTLKTKRKKSFWKKALYIVAGFFLFLFLAGWMFLNFFSDGLINSIVIPKLSAQTRIATHGRYALTLGSIKYSQGTVLCKTFELVRVRYDSSENGMVPRQITIDTVRFTGISLWDIVWGNPISLNTMEINTPKVYMTDASLETPSPDVIGDSLKRLGQLPKKDPVVSFDAIVAKDINVFLPPQSHPGDEPALKGFSVRLTDFLYNSEDQKQNPLLYSKRVDFSLPSVNYVTKDSFYTISVRNLKASLSDSLLTIDSFSYRPNYSEDVYAAKHRVVKAAIDFRCTNLRMDGINFTKLFAGINMIEMRKFEAGTWYIDSYLDRRRPPDTHPADAPMPNDLLRSLPIKLNIGSVVMNDGKIRVRERAAKGSLQPGVLFFDRSRIAISPICSDSLSKNFGEPSAISVSTYFVGEGLLKVEASYPLLDKAFNLKIHATIGGFNVKKLNTWLIPFEKLEVTDGMVKSGTIDMNIRSGTATTTVTPRYTNFSMKVLASDSRKSPGILEKIKTFIANTFVLKGDNKAEKDELAKSGTATVTRHKDEEFMQFLWISLRKSLGKVVGGFK